MSGRFKNSRSRVERATFHLQALVQEWKSLLAEESVSPVVRYDEDSGWYIASVELSPIEIAKVERSNFVLEIGEIAYQLRAALDGLVWEAVTIMQGAEPAAHANGLHRLDFPIHVKPSGFKNNAIHSFPFPQQLRDWLETIQPYAADKPPHDPDRGLKATLEDIHDLARLDRHRRLRVAVVYPTSGRFKVNGYPFPVVVCAHELIEGCNLLSGNYDFLRFKLKAVSGATPYKLSLQLHVGFEVSVENIEPYDGEELGRQLLRFVRAVGRVIDRFDEEFS